MTTPSYFDAYENLAMTRDGNGVLTVRFHTDGGPMVFTGRTHEDFPRALSIEASDDGATWQTLFRGGTAGRTFTALLQSPEEVPLTFDFSPVSTRYLRLHLLASDETHYWSVAELRVLGSLGISGR